MEEQDLAKNKTGIQEEENMQSELTHPACLRAWSPFPTNSHGKTSHQQLTSIIPLIPTDRYVRRRSGLRGEKKKRAPLLVGWSGGELGCTFPSLPPFFFFFYFFLSFYALSDPIPTSTAKSKSKSRRRREKCPQRRVLPAPVWWCVS